MWYGKAPGVDRAGDAFRHANAAGTAAKGGVLLVAGDDHGCKSSSAVAVEFTLVDLGVPVLDPANVQDVLDYGLFGWALSRYAGLWTGLIALADTMDSTATIDAGRSPIRCLRISCSRGWRRDPPRGRAAGTGSAAHRAQPARGACVRAGERNDRLVVPSPQAEVGIVATGKAWLDVCQALTELGLLDDEAVTRAGVRLMKIGMPWPLDDGLVRDFARGLDRILVVEENGRCSRTNSGICSTAPPVRRPCSASSISPVAAC